MFKNILILQLFVWTSWVFVLYLTLFDLITPSKWGVVALVLFALNVATTDVFKTIERLRSK